MPAFHVVKVVLADSSYGYDAEYTYRYPDLLLGVIGPGMRVLVPFGRGNTKRIGLITRVYEKDITQDEVIKPIIRLVDDSPLINDELLDMVFWLKEHTFCTYFEGFKTIVPSGYAVIHKSVYTLANSRPDAELTQEEESLYQVLCKAGCQRETDRILSEIKSDNKERDRKSVV